MRPAEAKRSYTFWWVFQRFSGVLLLVTLLGHVFMVHFNLLDFKAVSLTPEEVARRYGSSGMRFFYAAFLLLAVPHGINGVLNAVEDYIRHDLWRTAATWAAWTVGLGIMLWGLFTLV